VQTKQLYLPLVFLATELLVLTGVSHAESEQVSESMVRISCGQRENCAKVSVQRCARSSDSKSSR
jgi:hypothetical protein